MNVRYLQLPTACTTSWGRAFPESAARLGSKVHISLPGLSALAIGAAISAAWMLNTLDWDFGGIKALTAVCSGSLVAAVTIGLGWASEPEALKQWALRAALAVALSSAPLI